MNLHFEEHYPLRTSRLEQWREEIAAMRAAKWPHQRIADWLQSEQQFSISAEAVRQFCKVRGILKPKGKITPSPRSKRGSSPRPKTIGSTTPNKKAKLFEYDDTKPIQIRRS